MSELSSDAKGLIEQGRLDDGPGTDDKARIRQRLMSELGAGVFVTAAMSTGLSQSIASAPSVAQPSAAQTSALVGRAVRSLWQNSMVKLLAATSVVGALYVGVQGVTLAPPPHANESRSRALDTPLAPPRPRFDSAQPAAPQVIESEPEAAPEPQAVQIAEPAPARSASSFRSRAEGPRTSTNARVADPTISVAVPPRALRNRAAESKPVPGTMARDHARASSPTGENAEAVPRTSIAAELALLELAQRALRDAQPSTALQLAGQHAARFPQGTLGEERSGIEALARCQLGDRSHPAIDAFLARAASSPLATRVRKECGRP